MDFCNKECFWGRHAWLHYKEMCKFVNGVFSSVNVTQLKISLISITGRSLSLHHRMRIRMPLQRIPITRLLRRPHRNCSRCQPRTLAHGQLRSRPYQGYPFPWWIRSRQRALRCSWQGRRRKYLILRATTIKEQLLIKTFFSNLASQTWMRQSHW